MTTLAPRSSSSGGYFLGRGIGVKPSSPQGRNPAIEVSVKPSLPHTGTRRLIGQRLDGIVHVYDEPAAGDQPSYLVETHLERNSELRALVDDYLAKAQRLGYAPMHGWF